MTLTTTCCINIPPTSPPPSHPSKLNQVSWEKNEGTWKKQCFVGMTCMVMMGSEMLPVLGGDFRATAEDLIMAKVETNVQRWSDKRVCPPWRMNSLETIVPENLPRPSAHRRSESVSLGRNRINRSNNQIVRLPFRSIGDCFTL